MRRRKPRVVWIPSTNAHTIDGPVGLVNYQTMVIQPVGTTGDVAVGEIPLVIDGEADPLGTGNTLSDIENSGYRLRRIVGKIWVQSQQTAIDGPVECIVTAGLIVRRTDESSGISYALLTADADLVSPSQIRNIADPWIWRRSWVLGNREATGANQSDDILVNNWSYGPSAVDGPHIDQKTARIVGPEERLFLDVSCTIRQPGNDPDIGSSYIVTTDLRVLGSMRVSSGNRRNASR